MRKHKVEMKIMVATIIMLLVSIVTPTWAIDLSCWSGIAECLTEYETEDQILCCPLIRTEVTTNRECFCSIKPTYDINPSAKRGFTTFLNDECSIEYTFDMLCPDEEAPPSTPIQPPPSDDDYLLTPQTTTRNSVPDPEPEEPSPSGGGANLQVLIPAILVPALSVIGGLVKLYFVIKDRKRKKSLEGQPVV